MSDYKFTLNMIPNTGTPVVVNLSQGDIGRELTFKLVEGSDSYISGWTAGHMAGKVLYDANITES